MTNTGIPTFRGEGGLWRTHRAQDVATTTAFKKDPSQVWEVSAQLELKHGLCIARPPSTPQRVPVYDD